MAKKITIYVPDELSIYTWRDIVQLAKKGLSDTGESSVTSVKIDSSDILDKIYRDTQFIVKSIKNKADNTDMSNQKEKLTMSKLWWVKWLNYKAHELAGWSQTGEWWIEFDELLLSQPYKAIKANIDSWEYVLD